MNRERLREHENRVLAQMIWELTYPSPHPRDEVSAPELARRAGKTDWKNNALAEMTEREVRNAVRRLKKHGMIKRAWQKTNPDQPSGEYGEVWDDSPFIPHHGYEPTEAGMASETAEKAREWVDREWKEDLKILLAPDPEQEP